MKGMQKGIVKNKSRMEMIAKYPLGSVVVQAGRRQKDLIVTEGKIGLRVNQCTNTGLSRRN